jgi:hypothetical protein
VLRQPRRKIGERREELGDDDLRSIDVENLDHFRRRRAIEHADAREQSLTLDRGAHVEVMHHHHAAERNFLRDLTARAVLGQTLQDAVLRREFSACH